VKDERVACVSNLPVPRRGEALTGWTAGDDIDVTGTLSDGTPELVSAERRQVDGFANGATALVVDDERPMSHRVGIESSEHVDARLG
jgi:hypothetical protein